LGIVLATQNPVDLDYKGLSNAGTWFIGRLQTERDKARLIEGLEGAGAGAGANFNRQRMEQVLAGLGPRIFLMNNTHDDGPEVFQTRWTMSYLRGPLTRNQIKTLMDPVKASQPSAMAAPQAVVQPAAAWPPAAPSVPAAVPASAAAAEPPSIPPEVPQFFVPVRGAAPVGSGFVYRPMVLGAAKVNFVDAKAKVDYLQDIVCLTAITDSAIPVTWEGAEDVSVAARDLERSARQGGQFVEPPPAAAKARNYDTWQKDFTAWLATSRTLSLLKSPSVGQVSRPGEAERGFRVRLQQEAREQRDSAAEKLKAKYAPKTATLQERLRRAQQTVDREEEQVRQQKMQTAISAGSTLLGAFVGRRLLSATTLGRATTTARGASRTLKEQQDIGRAQDTVAAVQQQLTALDEEFKAEMAQLGTKIDPLTEELETITVKAKKANVSVQLVTLAWVPYWQPAGGRPETPAF
jgi:hypothetical protein